MKITERLTRSWFGIRPGQAEQYFRRIVQMQEREAEELERAIQSERSHLANLRKAAETKLCKEAQVPDLGLQEGQETGEAFRLQRMLRSLEALKRQGEAETNALRRMYEHKVAAHSARMQELDRQLQEYTDALRLLAAETEQWLSRLQEWPDDTHGIDLAEEIESALSMSWNGLEMEKPDGMTDAAADEEKGGADEAVASAKVIQFRMRTLLSRMDAKLLQLDGRAHEAAVTSDGTAAHAVPAASAAIAAASAPAAFDGLTHASASLSERFVARPKLDLSPTGFWGDLEGYMPEPAGVPPLAAVRQPPPLAVVRQEKPLPQEPEPEPEPDSEGGSPALSQEIKALQIRYMVGKAAGENLYGDNGTLIAAKGSTITPAVIEAAARAGKLPDLIVNMVIPGFGEEEA